jgi:hypothetical protein
VLSDDDLGQALLLLHDPGAGIGWHRDRPLHDHVVGISLGVRATMRLRRRREGWFDRASVPIKRRSIDHLAREVRHDWGHSIVQMEQTRWSVMFRIFFRKGFAVLNYAESSRVQRRPDPEEIVMADNKTLRGPQDSARIAMGKDYEVAYWTDKLGVSRDRLQHAVDAVGNSAAAVERHLKQ